LIQSKRARLPDAAGGAARTRPRRGTTASVEDEDHADSTKQPPCAARPPHELRQEGEKNSATFGLSALVSAPARTLAQRYRASGAGSLAARAARQQHFHADEAEIGGTCHFTNVNAADDAASSADRPSAAANT